MFVSGTFRSGLNFTLFFANSKFYAKIIVYFDHNGFTYWTMGAPIEEATIINQTQKENSYKVRLQNGALPQK